VTEPRRRWDPSTFKYHERGDRTFVEAPTPMCDFCLSPDVKWEYPATRMPLVGHPLINESTGEWAACDGCKELIDAHKLGPLVERSIRGQQEAARPDNAYTKPLPIWRRELRENLLRFMDARTGPPRPFTPIGPIEEEDL
jgi:hypothetical protein